MTVHPTDLAAQLERLTEAAPPSTIDIARARTVGRRRLRRRRVLVAAVITVVTLAAAATPVWVSAHVERGRPIATRSTATQPPATNPNPNPNADPLMAKARFGWLPASIVGVGYTVGDHGTNTVAVGPSVPGSTGTHIYLFVYPVGVTPSLTTPAGLPQVQVPAPPVNGHPAYWITGNASDPTNGGSPVLRWQTDSGQWVGIFAEVLAADDLLTTVHRIAAGVTVGDTPVPLPLYVTGLPAGFQLSDAELSRPSDDKPWRLQLTYLVKGSFVTIDVSPSGGSRPAEGTCSKGKGLDLCILLPNGASALDSIGGVAGLRRRITLLGTNEHDWTTNVLR
jgi:hypothetical protein